MKKITALLLILSLGFAAPASAFVVACTNCSNNAMQSLQYALETSRLMELKKAYDEYIQQTAQQIEMVRQNIEQYSNMVQNTVQLPSNLIRQVSGDLSKLGAITGSLNTLRKDVMGIANVFDELYRTQDEFKKLANLPKELLSGGGQTYNTYWDKWSERVDESTKATFQLSGKQLQDLANSGQLESYINQLLSTPDGQQKAIMAGNQLAALQIQEARQLRELVATKFQADLSIQEKAEKEKQMDQELHRQMLSGFKEAKPNADLN